jgi:hypothetical protein
MTVVWKIRLEEDGVVRLEASDGSVIAKIPASMILNEMGINPNLLPSYQRLAMVAKSIIEHSSEGTITRDGKFVHARSTKSTAQHMEDGKKWLIAEWRLRRLPGNIRQDER